MEFSHLKQPRNACEKDEALRRTTAFGRTEVASDSTLPYQGDTCDGYSYECEFEINID